MSTKQKNIPNTIKNVHQKVQLGTPVETSLSILLNYVKKYKTLDVV